MIGDGSTSDTGPQPNQPTVDQLDRRSGPPQFVVVSWDGAGELSDRLFSRFREVARRNNAHMTFFLSGIYLLPEHRKHLYHPPKHPVGASDIGYLSEESIHRTIRQLDLAWREGHEIGTHFNGHFCGPDGVDSWSPEQWVSEIEQARWMVQNWKTTTGHTELDPLPFDYDTELIGGRAPCLEGQENLLKAAAELGFRYDSSGSGTQVWPERREGVWDIPLQLVPMPGHSYETLAMDYNFMVNQSGEGGDGDPAMYQRWRAQTRDALLSGFQRAYEGNRAPLIIGNHFNDWNGGIYMDAIEDVVKDVCPREDVECVSFRQLVDWLDAQDPETLRKLRGLEVGQPPPGGWERYLADGSPNGAGGAAGVDGASGTGGVAGAVRPAGREGATGGGGADA